VRFRRISGPVILVGYAGIVGGSVALITATNTYRSKGYLASAIAMIIAYGLVGFGTWRSARACRNDDGAASVLRNLTRWVAAASAALVIVFAFDAYETYQTYSANRAQFPRYYPHFDLQIEGELACVAGFLIAAVGLWMSFGKLSVATAPPHGS
jgi:hypothetical protein